MMVWSKAASNCDPVKAWNPTRVGRCCVVVLSR